MACWPSSEQMREEPVPSSPTQYFLIPSSHRVTSSPHLPPSSAAPARLHFCQFTHWPRTAFSLPSQEIDKLSLSTPNEQKKLDFGFGVQYVNSTTEALRKVSKTPVVQILRRFLLEIFYKCCSLLCKIFEKTSGVLSLSSSIQQTPQKISLVRFVLVIL